MTRWWLHGQTILWSRFWMALRKGHGAGYDIRTAWFCARCSQYVAAGKFIGQKFPIKFEDKQ